MEQPGGGRTTGALIAVRSTQFHNLDRKCVRSLSRQSLRNPSSTDTCQSPRELFKTGKQLTVSHHCLLKVQVSLCVSLPPPWMPRCKMRSCSPSQSLSAVCRGGREPAAEKGLAPGAGEGPSRPPSALLQGRGHTDPQAQTQREGRTHKSSVTSHHHPHPGAAGPGRLPPGSPDRCDFTTQNLQQRPDRQRFCCDRGHRGLLVSPGPALTHRTFHIKPRKKRKCNRHRFGKTGRTEVRQAEKPQAECLLPPGPGPWELELLEGGLLQGLGHEGQRGPE